MTHITYDPRAADRTMRASMLNQAAGAALAKNEETCSRAAGVASYIALGLAFTFCVFCFVLAI